MKLSSYTSKSFIRLDKEPLMSPFNFYLHKDKIISIKLINIKL